MAGGTPDSTKVRGQGRESKASKVEWVGRLGFTLVVQGVTFKVLKNTM
jgi:hypothetical protein